MKNLFFSSILFTIFLIASCDTSELKISEPSAIESQRIKTIGDTLSKNLLVALKSELSAAIQEKGVVNAIQVCNIKALPITAEIAKSEEFSVDIKRTTARYRNPQNKPDMIENLVLEQYMNFHKEKQPLPSYTIQKISKDNKSYFNYYKPLKMARLCLLCHGDPQSMDESLTDVLNRLYPNDLATGYNEGDFRALLRIKFTDNN